MPDLPDPLSPVASERLQAVLRISLRITAERDLQRLMQLVISETTKVLEADRSSLFLVDQTTNELWAMVAQGVDAVELRFPVGKGLAGSVAAGAGPINLEDAHADPRFNPEFDRLTGYLTRSVLCVPLTTPRGEIVGVVEALNKETGGFTGEDEVLLTAIAAQAAVAIDNAGLYRSLTSLNRTLERRVEERTAQLSQANTRLSALNQQLEALSITDSLTHAYNRRYFLARLRDACKRARRYGNRVALLMMDVDHFKQINDTKGHVAGDAVLEHVAEVIQNRLRDTDVFGRYGGEEFCLLAAGADHDNAVLLGERLRAAVEANPYVFEGTEIRVTISVGVASWEPALGQDAEALVRLADSALYRAKAEGRNRVSAATLDSRAEG